VTGFAGFVTVRVVGVFQWLHYSVVDLAIFVCREFQSAVGSELSCDRMSCYARRYIQYVSKYLCQYVCQHNFWGTVQHVDLNRLDFYL
jgi:hypothetical protein